MSPTQYERTSLIEMKRRRWRANRYLSGPAGAITSGLEILVVEKYRGLTVSTVPCAHCGLAVKIENVSPWAIEEILP